ncbi:hypothetical protein LXA43DRAFT_1009145 [Ganoderma leucocontextum]|nr:hypothetical protein LXA43DRAFT_1009145 [Ganoderma leucocontextum]
MHEAVSSSVYHLQTLDEYLAIERISTFLSNGKTAVIPGAGVSVDSGIRTYRGNTVPT